jgi:hypothetical protein
MKSVEFIVDLLEATYDDIVANSWQQAKLKAAKRYKEENGSKLPIASLASLARATKKDGGRSPRVMSLKELLS